MTSRKRVDIDDWSSSFDEYDTSEYMPQEFFADPCYDDLDKMEDYFPPFRQTEALKTGDTFLTREACVSQYGKTEDDGFEFTMNLLDNEGSFSEESSAEDSILETLFKNTRNRIRSNDTRSDKNVKIVLIDGEPADPNSAIARRMMRGAARLEELRNKQNKS